MKRTPEHEQMIDELVEKTGLDRRVVEEATDIVLRHLANILAEKVAKQMLEDFANHKFAAGGFVKGPFRHVGDSVLSVLPSR